MCLAAAPLLTSQHGFVEHGTAAKQNSVTRHNRVFLHKEDVAWKQLRRINHLQFKRRYLVSRTPGHTHMRARALTLNDTPWPKQASRLAAIEQCPCVLPCLAT